MAAGTVGVRQGVRAQGVAVAHLCGRRRRRHRRRGGAFNGELSALLPVARSIDQGAADINEEADRLILQTVPIDQDLTNADYLFASIEISAESICNSPVFMAGC